jgi:hypothetical protein
MIRKIAINTGGGCAGVGASAEGKTGVMIALQPPRICSDSPTKAVAKIKLVPIDDDEVMTARSLDIRLGD